MGIDGMSKSQVSEFAKHLDVKVAEFRNRLLDEGPYSYLWLDALFHKVREGGRVVSLATVAATGVNADDHREKGSNTSHASFICGGYDRADAVGVHRGRDGR
jgi:transposase-like protein